MMDDVNRRNALKLAAAGMAAAGVAATAEAQQTGHVAGAEHLARMESRIKEVDRAMTGLADPGFTQEMLQLIRRPGWTTVAEGLLVMAALDSMHAQAQALAAHRQAFMKGCVAVAGK